MSCKGDPSGIVSKDDPAPDRGGSGAAVSCSKQAELRGPTPSCCCSSCSHCCSTCCCCCCCCWCCRRSSRASQAAHKLSPSSLLQSAAAAAAANSPQLHAASQHHTTERQLEASVSSVSCQRLAQLFPPCRCRRPAAAAPVVVVAAAAAAAPACSSSHTLKSLGVSRSHMGVLAGSSCSCSRPLHPAAAAAAAALRP